MRVRGVKHHLAGFQIQFVLQAFGDVGVDRLRDAQGVRRENESTLGALVLEGERFDPERLRGALRDIGPRAVAGHPERLLGRDVEGSGACFPVRLSRESAQENEQQQGGGAKGMTHLKRTA